jgi:hypothetical protein
MARRRGVAYRRARRLSGDRRVVGDERRGDAEHGGHRCELAARGASREVVDRSAVAGRLDETPERRDDALAVDEAEAQQERDERDLQQHDLAVGGRRQGVGAADRDVGLDEAGASERDGRGERER